MRDILCAIGLHDWTPWRDDGAPWYSRACARGCGAGEKRRLMVNGMWAGPWRTDAPVRIAR